MAPEGVVTQGRAEPELGKEALVRTARGMIFVPGAANTLQTSLRGGPRHKPSGAEIRVMPL